MRRLFSTILITVVFLALSVLYAGRGAMMVHAEHDRMTVSAPCVSFDCQIPTDKAAQSCADHCLRASVTESEAVLPTVLAAIESVVVLLLVWPRSTDGTPEFLKRFSLAIGKILLRRRLAQVILIS